MANQRKKVRRIFPKFSRRTLRTRLLSGFIIIASLPVLTAAIISLAIGLFNWRQQSFERLETVADSKQEAILRWADSVEQKLAIAANSDCGYDRINVIVSLAREDKYLQFYNRVVRNHFVDFLTQAGGIQALSLADRNGLIILSSDIHQEGGHFSDLKINEEIMAKPSLSIIRQDSTKTETIDNFQILASSPISGLSSDEKGLLIAQPRLDRLVQILNDYTGLGKTGKTYLITPDHLLFADSRLQDDLSNQSNLTFTPTEGLRKAIESKAVISGIFPDFRQRDVLAVYRWLPELGVVLAVEQDRMETFATIFETLGINLVIVTISLAVAIALSMVVVRDIVQPITDLADTATCIAAGDLDQIARVNQTDEIGILASAFNSMTAQLRELITNLEKRVADRTQELERLALQLETSARVGREITSILEIDELLSKVSELIRGAFDYYGVHIFLLDEGKNQLIFNGTWEDKPYHVTLEVGQDSLNGKAVLQNQAILANDVALEPSYRMDDHYPDTQAELVVPLRIGNRVIGTLDILSTEKHAFNPDDMLVVQSLGDQIAIAIENARLYERSRELAVLEERNRMARELHDSMNQSLYSVILFTGAARNEADQIGSQAIQNFLERAENMAKQALKEMRLLVYELRPLELEEKGFLGALQQRLDTVEGRAGIDVELKINQQSPLPYFLEDALFRIVQEALNNIIKHSNATKVIIEMEINEEVCKMRVVDNGIGFDPALIQTRHGMGLINMRERAEKLGGKLSIKSTPSLGTEVEFEIDFRLIA